MAGGYDKRGHLLETPIQKLILDELTRQGIFCWRQQNITPPRRIGGRIVGLRKADPRLTGIPDIMAVYKGRLIAIEVKREVGGVQTDEQKRWEADLRANGAIHILARSWSDVVVPLIEHGILLKNT